MNRPLRIAWQIHAIGHYVEDVSDEVPAPEFVGVIGHERPRRMLARAIERDRLHHAILLSGPEGIGKTTLAVGLACATLCPEAPARGCGQCDVCHRIASGNHTDVQRLVGSGTGGKVKIDDTRAAITRTLHAPFESAHHFLLIDADALSASVDSSNALLKTFEEPPEGVHFVLLSQNPALLLDTIVSRSVHLRLGPLTDDRVQQVVERELRGQSGDDDPGPEPEQIVTAVRLSQGRPGFALSLLADHESLEPTRAFLTQMIRAAEAGPAAIFAGDRSPLWQSYEAAWASIADPEAQEDAPAEPEVVVVKAAGRKKKQSGAKKSSKKKLTEARARKIRPYQQRTATLRMADLWAIHLREQLRGHDGLPGIPKTGRNASDLVSQLDRVRSLRDSLARNPNVRLALEQALLDMSPPATNATAAAD